jgi:hypothetical protein
MFRQEHNKTFPAISLGEPETVTRVIRSLFENGVTRDTDTARLFRSTVSPSNANGSSLLIVAIQH